MSPEKQCIAIAEATGWKRCHKGCDGRTWRYPDDSGCTESLPDYLTDLNAMHEAEKAGKYHTGDYCRMLASITSGGKVENMTQYNLLHATAAQRAEAFLRTLNLWEEAADV